MTPNHRSESRWKATSHPAITTEQTISRPTPATPYHRSSAACIPLHSPVGSEPTIFWTHLHRHSYSAVCIPLHSPTPPQWEWGLHSFALTCQLRNRAQRPSVLLRQRLTRNVFIKGLVAGAMEEKLKHDAVLRDLPVELSNPMTPTQARSGGRVCALLIAMELTNQYTVSYMLSPIAVLRRCATNWLQSV
jgi:hypothetical protein